MQAQLSTSPPRSKSDLWLELTEERVLRHARTSMLAFTRYMNPEFRINWHHVRICQALDDFLAGKILRLMIFLQPQIGKSELVSRHFPAYALGHFPDLKYVNASYGDEFASLFNLDVQRIIDTDKYRSLFPDTTLDHGRGDGIRNSSTFDIIGHRGRYHTVGVGGSLTGRTAHILGIDDPIKNHEDARNQRFHEKQFRWFTSTARTRLKKTPWGVPGRVLLTMTRWSHDDLAQRLIDIAKANPNLPQWTVLSFPAIRDNLDDPLDPRKLGEALWPEAMSLEELDEIRLTNLKDYTSLYQQSPTPESGTIFKRKWFEKWYTQLPQMDVLVQSWDLTFDETENGSYVVGQVWGKRGPDKYLIDQVRVRCEFHDQLTLVRSLTAKHPGTADKWVEKKANGAALLSVLKREIAGLIPVEPRGSKPNRARAIAPQYEAGNVWLPHPNTAPWVHDFIEEHMAFPDGKNDDQVDAGSQALLKLEETQSYDWAPVSITGPSKWRT